MTRTTSTGVVALELTGQLSLQVGKESWVESYHVLCLARLRDAGSPTLSPHLLTAYYLLLLQLPLLVATTSAFLVSSALGSPSVFDVMRDHSVWQQQEEETHTAAPPSHLSEPLLPGVPGPQSMPQRH